MRVRSQMGWLAGLALLAGVAGCSGADVPSETEAGSEQANVSAPPAAFCGGIAAIPCAVGQTCVDDPNDDCDAKQGGSDCGGICVDNNPKQAVCGGFAGKACPNGQMCVDDPSDNCDPKRGGSDCSGICVYARRTW